MKKIFYVFFMFVVGLSLFFTGCSQNDEASFYFYVANNNIRLSKNQTMSFEELSFITNLPSITSFNIKSNNLNIVKIEDKNIVAVDKGSTTLVVDALYCGNVFSSDIAVNINDFESEDNNQEFSEQNLLSFCLFPVEVINENIKLFKFNILKNNEITGDYCFLCNNLDIEIYRDGQMLNVIVKDNYDFFVTITDTFYSDNLVIVDFNEYVDIL